MGKTQKEVNQKIQLLTESKQDRYFCFSKVNLIASTSCTLCAEYSYHGQPGTLGKCHCYSLSGKSALMKHLFVGTRSKGVLHAPGSLKMFKTKATFISNSVVKVLR